MKTTDGEFRRSDLTESVPCKVTVTSTEIIIYPQSHMDFISWDRNRVTIRSGDNVTEIAKDGHTLTIENSSASILTEVEVGRQVSSGRLPRRFVTFVLISVALFLCLLLAIYFWVLPYAASRAVILVPKEIEIQIGEKLAAVYAPDLNNQELDSVNFYLQAIVKSLEFNTDYPVIVRAIPAEEINAFALPGGKIFVYAGMLKKMDNHGQLVALIGHELTHVKERHSLKSIMNKAASGVLISAIFGSPADLTGWIMSKADEFRQLDYSRELETEADNEGIEFMESNKVSAQGMLQLLELLKTEHGKNPAMMKYLSTHPETEERIDNARKRITPDSLAINTGLAQKFTKLQQHLK